MKFVIPFVFALLVLVKADADDDNTLNKRYAPNIGYGGGGGQTQTRVIQLGSLDELLKLLNGLGASPGGLQSLGGNNFNDQIGNQLGNQLGNSNFGNPYGQNQLGNPSSNNQVGASGGDFRQAALEETNKFRAQHGAGPLVLDDQLNRESQAYAERLAQTNVMEHSCRVCNDYGENLYAMSGMIGDPAQTARNAVDSWYNEVKMYNYNNPVFSMNTGHFTALVWKGTRKMGFGLASNPATQSTFVVARYVPPGNTRGAFAENVGRGR